MTNNDYFLFLLHLTGLTKDFEATAKLFQRKGWDVTKSKIKVWRTRMDNDRASRMPDAALQAFMSALFELRDEAGEMNIVLFDCRGIFEEMNKKNEA